MQKDNPVGTDGFDFLEYATPNPQKLTQQFHTFGLVETGQHRTKPVTVFEQNEVRFFLNSSPDSHAQRFANIHGSCVTAMGFRVKNAQYAFEYAVTKGAKPYEPSPAERIYDLPAIYGVGGSLIYFVDYQNSNATYAHQFDLQPNSLKTEVGLTYIDHVTHNLERGNMKTWADFYTDLFGFYEVRYFDIEGRLTGLKSKAMTSPCGKIRIPLNESSDDQSQIEEFIKEFKGEGIQHIALGTNDIYHSIGSLRTRGLEFLDTPDTYYDLIEKRLPDHGEPLDQLKRHRILIDGNTIDEKKILLQIFTKNMLGPVFFEVIQRKGDEGFGEGNFRALFESIELDQIRRGVLTVEEVR